MDESTINFVNEYFSKFEEFNELTKRMKLIEEKIKKEMIKKEINYYKLQNGTLTLVHQNRMMLNRSLIPNIEDYMENTTVCILFKSTN